MERKSIIKTAIFAASMASCTAFIANASIKSEAASRPNDYFYDDGHSPLKGHPNYGDGKLLNLVKRGDIFFDANGFNYGVKNSSLGNSGHIAIIEGVFWDENWGDYYIRTIEAPGSGSVVSRGVLDLDRYLSMKGQSKILRVKDCSDTERHWATIFCRDQIGIPYPTDVDKKHIPAPNFYPYGGVNPYQKTIEVADLTSWLYRNSKNSDEPTPTSWYCSELIYAAYYTATDGRIDLDPNKGFCWPKEIRDSNCVEDISGYSYRYSYSGHHSIYFGNQYVATESCEYHNVNGKTICGKCGHC